MAMIEIIENIDSLIEKYEAFIFDAYGVFILNGKLSLPTAIKMEKIIKSGKPIYILSNSPRMIKSAEASYIKRGLIKGVQYTELLTSGEFGNQLIKSGKISVRGKKIWVLGKANVAKASNVPDTLEGTGALIIDDANDADYAYCGSINDENLEYNPNVGFIKNAEHFMDILLLLKEKNIPMIGFNPDYFSFENGIKALRQGAIIGAYKEMGGQIIVCGKPDVKIYNYLIKKIMKNHDISDLKKILMVGDTLRTDIKGANDAGISSCLVLDAGVSYLEYVDSIREDALKITKANIESFKKELEKGLVVPEYIVVSVA